jgi:hypothetical protein
VIHDDLDDFLADTRRHLDRELAASGAAPDLAASVARAREIDPAAVPAQAVAEVAALAPVAQLRPRSAPVPENMSDRSAVAPFAAALRDQLEADLARSIHRGAVLGASGSGPAVPASEAAASQQAPVAAPIALASRRRPVVVAALALAAAVLLSFGLRGAFEATQARPGALPGAAALLARASASAGGVVAPREAPRPVHEVAVPEDRPEPTPALPEAPVPEDSPDVAPEPARPGRRGPKDSLDPPRGKPRKPVREPTPASAPAEDPLAALDREAQALWRAGDLRGAADKFAEIVRRAPGSRAAETAYGDIFALEHQLGGDPVAPWRAYLRQFPRGRYADDARAGICRRAAADERRACWSEYLAAHPDGAHRREAEQAANEQ